MIRIFVFPDGQLIASIFFDLLSFFVYHIIPPVKGQMVQQMVCFDAV
jgi:hypothetical protein